MCIAFEVGAPTSWTCLTQCGCDAGPDAPADASAEVPADASGDAPADAAAD
jgi:hypothetical protein